MSRSHLSTALGLSVAVALAGCARESTPQGGDAPAPAAPSAATPSAAEPSGPSPAPFRAGGNEPSWRLEIGSSEMILLTNFGQDRLVLPTPAPETSGDTTRYVARGDDGDFVVTVTDRLCVDSMSGMPHPQTVAVENAGQTLNGCGGEPVSLLQGPEWSVAAIDGAPVLSGSNVTLEFGPDGRLAGQAPCSRFGGRYSLSGEGVAISPEAGSETGCDAAVAAAETAFLGALAGVQGFSIGPDGSLLLRTGDGRAIEARRP